MIRLPWGIIAAIAAGLMVTVTLAIMALRLQTVNAKLEASELREKGWIEEQARCKENEIALTEAAAESMAQAQEIVILQATLQGSSDATHEQAVERARAEAELRTVEEKYANLSTRAVDMDVCQTYELALAALAGGTQ